MMRAKLIFLMMLFTNWFYLFTTAFFCPRTCPHPRKIVLGLKDLSSTSTLASRICPRLTSLTPSYIVPLAVIMLIYIEALSVCVTKVWAGQVNCGHRTRVEPMFYITASIWVCRSRVWCSCSRIHSGSLWLGQQTMGTSWAEEASS